MTLHTTSDGQITYEGLPVVNQEEVKKWLWYKQTGGYGAPFHQWETLTNHDYELPDEEFEAYKVFRSKKVRILRKPVSEEGEKNTYTGMKDTVSGAIKQSGEKNKGLGGSSSLEEVVTKIRKMINDHWRFDNNQQPLSSWHEKQDLLEEIDKLICNEKTL